ncbi:MAG: undecaprenyl-diphosphatase UppP [Patescibacteria group bacterium]
MSIIQAVILGIIQGITEFLPISSSGHLVLAEKVFEGFGRSDFGLAFDIFLHLGTLLAIIIYFWRDWLKILKDLFQKKGIFGYIILATVPAAIAGVFLEDLIAGFFRNIFFVAIFFIITGGFFIFSEKIYARRQFKNLEKITWGDALFIGAIQIFALLPGISRSGSTIAAGMLRGLPRQDAARFSFLMATLIIFGSGIFSAVSNLKTSAINNLILESVFGFIFAVGAGYFSIAFLMRFLEKRKLYGFAGYLIIMGIILLGWQVLF